MQFNNKILKVLKGEKTKSVPLWMMRQAGRYLPEYREIRKMHTSFWDMCFNPDIAMQITLQPVLRFNMDAAIIFSDILTVPLAMGQEIKFIPQIGPVAEKIKTLQDAKQLSMDIKSFLSPVYHAINAVKDNTYVPTIGFIGAPYTITQYMMGMTKKNMQYHRNVSNHSNANYSIEQYLIQKTTDTITEHAILQIENGASIIQIFESFGCYIDHYQDFIKLSFQPIANIIQSIKSVYPEVPIIVYASNCKYAYEFCKIADCLSIHHEQCYDKSDDKSYDKYIKCIDNLNADCVIQGNLSPIILRDSTAEQVQDATFEILKRYKNRNHIFNLGHGIDKNTPIENVYAMVAKVKQFEKY